MKKSVLFLSLMLTSVIIHGEQSRNVETESKEILTDTHAQPYSFALRTSFLFDIMLIPTVGAEWRMNENYGVKLDGGFSSWGSNTGSSVQKIWFVRPEVRRYIGVKKNFYAGASSNIGEYNIYKGMVGSIISDDTGYDGKFFNIGVCGGYLWHISQKIAFDFNIGMGYNKFKYDSFTKEDKTRVYKKKNKTNEFFGPTQICVSLVWKIN